MIAMPIRRVKNMLFNNDTIGGFQWTPLNSSSIESVKTFLFFIGWPRSCHSIIGSMLDAHPEAIVAHEFFLFQQLKRDMRLKDRKTLYNMLYQNSFKTAHGGWRSSKMQQKGYSLEIDGAWQGRCSKLQVIGDKTAGDSTRMYSHRPIQFRRFYRQLKNTVQVPVRVLHIVRNPYDMIATISLYRGSEVKEMKVNASLTNRYSNHRVLKEATDYVLQQSKAIASMIPDAHINRLEVHCEDLIQEPKKTMMGICQFLNLTCSPEYLGMCEEKTFTSISMSRYLVEWTEDLLLRVAKQINKYSFFKRYSFYDMVE